ncbi:MAG: Gfo/Idh/MocA family oxidoreductase [Candidatus Heimdallarchaeota archaeon]|nr:Gfo/Idh/MocA family oxidoreductase [Candidatus Heimdallarchaeota archaeon]
MIKPITAILIGAGDRGADVFGEYALSYPNEIRFIAVAEPDNKRRDIFTQKHFIEQKNSFSSWEPLLEKEKFADVAFITTQDQMHFDPAVLAMKKGYDVFLEKPMATTLEECKELVRVAADTGRILQIGHVLRYSPFFSTINNLISSGRIGEVVNISLRENVATFHYSHSFARGNWHNRDKSSPMILAKSCHDLDILHWFAGSQAVKISSFGSQAHFGKDNIPEGAPEYCIEGCPISKTCLYNATRIYLDIIPLLQISVKGSKGFVKFISKAVLRFPWLRNIPPFTKIRDYTGWPVSTISQDMTLEGKKKALTSTDYGRCVYRVTDHDTVDHQVVNIEFENEVTATFTMQGFSHEEGRTLRIDGTKGTIIGEFLLSGDKIVLHDSTSGKKKNIRKTGMSDGHGGGDIGIMKAFIRNVNSKDRSLILTDAQTSLESHLMAFAADISRLEERVVKMEDLRE